MAGARKEQDWKSQGKIETCFEPVLSRQLAVPSTGCETRTNTAARRKKNLSEERRQHSTTHTGTHGQPRNDFSCGDNNGSVRLSPGKHFPPGILQVPLNAG